MSDKNKEKLEKIRAELVSRQGGKPSDPTEWRPPKAQRGQTLTFKFIVLPPLEPGAPCANGKAKTDMKDKFGYKVGLHWINNKPHSCPRVADDSTCPYCSHGFALLKETDDQEQRKQIIKAFLPREAYYINVYFPAVKSNPADLQGKVKWVSISQKSILDRFTECIMRDEADAKGDTEEENQAYGLFYLADESYHFLMNITLKNQYNDYSGSKFIPSTRGPIVRNAEGELDVARMDEILKQRHDLVSKFPMPDAKKLAGLLNVQNQPAAEAEDVGFDDDETKPAAPKVAQESVEEEQEAPVAKASVAPKPVVKSTPKPTPPAAADDSELDDLLKDINS